MFAECGLDKQGFPKKHTRILMCDLPRPVDFVDCGLSMFPPVSSCVPSLCTPNLDFERGGCWRTRVTHDTRTVFSDELMADLGGS